MGGREALPGEAVTALRAALLTAVTLGATMLIRRCSGATIFGSMHLLPEAYTAELMELVRPMVERCTTLVLECEAPPLGYLPPHARLPAGQSLEAILPTEFYSEAISAGRALGISREDLSTSSPWWAAERLEIENFRALGLSGQFSVEKLARELAQAAGRQISVLEGIDRGYLSRSQAPLSEQLWLLESVVKRPEENRAKLREMVHAFASGSIEAWERIMSDGALHQPETTDDLFRGRNLEWLPVIESELGLGNPLIVVGALHLVADTGLLALLRRNGHLFER